MEGFKSDGYGMKIESFQIAWKQIKYVYYIWLLSTGGSASALKDQMVELNILKRNELTVSYSERTPAHQVLFAKMIFCAKPSLALLCSVCSFCSQ